MWSTGGQVPDESPTPWPAPSAWPLSSGGSRCRCSGTGSSSQVGQPAANPWTSAWPRWWSSRCSLPWPAGQCSRSRRLLPRNARRIWTITALAVLLMSFAPLMAPGMDTATRLTLGVLHVAVAAVLTPAMTGTTVQPALCTAGETA
ncbi:DUF6069 family protein [Micromonospora sp. NPDC048830]|uniref:DUF6069 family protein n=1 Tax=Micromonospora sp. NPDC048830 TaxID=3364257 RepID=UPI0037218387